MSLKKHKLQVLSILFENLKETPPQLVSSTSIAGQMDISLPELQQILKSMAGMGIIETDPDQQYNLITHKGLLWLDQQQLRH
jgi:predicted transcriptional regulator